MPQESVSYEFNYQPGSLEAHPTVGRVAVLFRNDKLKLRWISLSRSIESFRIDPLNEVEMEEMLVEKVPLKPSGWNQVTLLNEGDQILVSINGMPTARFTPAMNMRFGFLCEKNRNCQIRNLKLTGPWPEAFPIDAMQPRETPIKP